MGISGNDHCQRLPVYLHSQKLQGVFPGFPKNIFEPPIDGCGNSRKITDEIDFFKRIFFWKDHW